MKYFKAIIEDKKEKVRGETIGRGKKAVKVVLYSIPIFLYSYYTESVLLLVKSLRFRIV